MVCRMHRPERRPVNSLRKCRQTLGTLSIRQYPCTNRVFRPPPGDTPTPTLVRFLRNVTDAAALLAVSRCHRKNLTLLHKMRTFKLFASELCRGNRLLASYCELLRDCSCEFYRWLCPRSAAERRCSGRVLLYAMHRRPAKWWSRQYGWFLSMRYTIRRSAAPAITIQVVKVLRIRL